MVKTYGIILGLLIAYSLVLLLIGHNVGHSAGEVDGYNQAIFDGACRVYCPKKVAQ